MVFVVTVILYIVLCLGFFFFFLMHCARSSISPCFSIGSLIVMVTDWTVFLHRLSDVRITDFIALYNGDSSPYS